MRPQFLGPYQLLSRLGHGGMGAVYEAVEQRSGQTVAIKVLAAHLADDAGVRGRFQTEIETLKSLKHAGIIQLLAYGEEDGHPYFAMELVRGQALDKIAEDTDRDRFMSADEAAEYGIIDAMLTKRETLNQDDE